MIKIHEIATKLQKKMQFLAISWGFIGVRNPFLCQFHRIGLSWVGFP